MLAVPTTLTSLRSSHEIATMIDNLPRAPGPLFDIGANLTHPSFQHDMDAVLDRAQQANIQEFLITGTSIEESKHAAQLAAGYPGRFYSTAGVHPHDADQYNDDSNRVLQELAALPQVVAIGECGLDFNRNFSSQEHQIKAFERQLELAITLQMPLFLHERDAHRTQWEILSHYRDQLNGAVIHCFTGDKDQAFAYLDLDMYIGITGWICDERRGYHLHEFVGDIPLDRLLIETDAPYLMPRVKPKPKLPSSRRNEPCTLPYVLQALVQHSDHSAEQLATATRENSRRLFGIVHP